MNSVIAYVNHEMLVWARESANYDLEEIAHKIGVSVKRLESWEEGTDFPTYLQLLKLANSYKRPSAMFFGKKIPEKPETEPDFRFLPDVDIKPKLSPKIIFELRNAESKRKTFINLKEELKEEITIFTLKANISEEEKDVVEKIKKALNISWAKRFSWKTADDALKEWISIIENLGVLIFQFVDIKPKEMRGYALNNGILPIIGINATEHAHGRIFTLLHELVHITLGKRGISNLYGYKINNNVERFCNRVAGEILVPTEILLSESIVVNNDSGNWEDYKLRILSNRFKVSKEVILRRLLTLELISEEFYDSKRDEFLGYVAPPSFEKGQKVRRDLTAFKSLKRNGDLYTDAVIASYRNELITTSELSDYLGVKLKYLPEIEQNLYRDRRFK